MALKKSLAKQVLGTASEFSGANPVLPAGVCGYITDTGEMRIGDGATAFNSLGDPYDAKYLKLTGGTLTGNLNGVTPTELGYLSGATSSLQNQINNIIAGLAWKTAVRVATTANITLSGTQTIDGVSVIAGDRVLVKNQSTASQNGIYLCASGSWTRTSDANTGALMLQATCSIEEGSTYADQMWTCSTNAPITIGSTSLTFIKTSNTTYTGSNGITLTANNFTLDNSYFTGDITASGGVTSIGNGKVTNSMLAGSISYSKLTLTGAILNADLAGSIDNSKLSNSAITINGTSVALGGSITIATGSAAILGAATYNPASAASTANATTTPAAVDTTNLRATFVAPSTGKVGIMIQTWVSQVGANAMLCVLDGSTNKGYVLAPLLNAPCPGILYVSGLTPGSTYNYDLGIYSTTAAVTVTAKCGGGAVAGFGAASIIIISG